MPFEPCVRTSGKDSCALCAQSAHSSSLLVLWLGLEKCRTQTKFDCLACSKHYGQRQKAANPGKVTLVGKPFLLSVEELLI